MLPEFIVWFVIFCVVWGVSIGISFYTRHNTNFKGLFNKRADSTIGGIYFVFGPICALAAITMGLIHFIKHRNLHAKIFNPFRILTSEGRHQIALEKERRQRELEKEERKRLEAQNETITKLLIESELETTEDNEESDNRELAVEINERFDEKVREEVDEVVGPLIKEKIAEAIEDSEIGSLRDLKDIDTKIESVTKDLRYELQDVVWQLEELEEYLAEYLEGANKGLTQTSDKKHTTEAAVAKPEETEQGFEQFMKYVE